ncbi:hypothetical protein AHAS_Ahas17G0170900 [Arachis hypogaea]
MSPSLSELALSLWVVPLRCSSSWVIATSLLLAVGHRRFSYLCRESSPLLSSSSFLLFPSLLVSFLLLCSAPFEAATFCRVSSL